MIENGESIVYKAITTKNEEEKTDSSSEHNSGKLESEVSHDKSESEASQSAKSDMSLSIPIKVEQVSIPAPSNQPSNLSAQHR